MMDDIYVYLVRLPDGIREMVAPSGIGYTVYIDDRLTRDERIKAYEHALSHIDRGDFWKDDRDVDDIEIDARGGDEDVHG